jgi:hypothetical protein
MLGSRVVRHWRNDRIQTAERPDEPASSNGPRNERLGRGGRRSLLADNANLRERNRRLNSTPAVI